MPETATQVDPDLPYNALQRGIGQKIADLRRRGFPNVVGGIPTKNEALAVMGALKINANILGHSLAVMRTARHLAHNLPKGTVDIALTVMGALWHDLGRCETHSMWHGPVGGDLIRGVGYHEALACIAERHMMAGLTAEEAKRFKLPLREYQPHTMEEQIVCLADKYHTGIKKVTIEARFGRWITKYEDSTFLHDQIARAKRLEEQILAQIF